MPLEEQVLHEMNAEETRDMGNPITEVMKTMFVIGKNRNDYANGTSTNEQEAIGNDGSTNTKVQIGIVTVLVRLVFVLLPFENLSLKQNLQTIV